MSYIVDPRPVSRPAWPRRVAVIVLVALALALLYWVGAGDGSAASSPAPLVDARQVSWSWAGPWPVPTAAGHGPFTTSAGLASGFSHDATGAALAAFNITYRLSSDVGPMVYESTAREQTVGDPDAMLAQIRLEPNGGSTPATEFFYKILAGDPTGDSVLISIAVRSADSTVRGGYFACQRSLRWRDGDWRMAVPMTPPSVRTSLPDYQSLGGPHV